MCKIIYLKLGRNVCVSGRPALPVLFREQMTSEH